MTSNEFQQQAQVAPPRAAWPMWVRIGFRFSLLYWTLYLMPNPGAVSLLDLPPWPTGTTTSIVAWPLTRLAHVVGVHLFHLTGEGADWHPTGSGDTAMNWVLLFCILVLSVVGTIVWSAISESRGKRREYTTAYAWLRLIMRMTLAATLISYGFAKIFPGQFGPLGIYGLAESYGDSTPMHLLWTFMGQSRPYTIFGGLMEAIPGALLLFRRTSTAGLLGAVAVMVNVVLMNFCYDVTVKQYSVHILLMAIFLLLPDLRPLWTFLFARQQAVLTGVWVRKPERKALRIAGHVVQGIVVLFCAWSLGYETYVQSRRPASADSPIYGAYAIDKADGLAATSGWKQIYSSGSGLVFADAARKRTILPAKYDSAQPAIEITKKDWKGTLNWTRDAAGNLTLTGTLKGQPMTVTAHPTTTAKSDKDFELNSRGFHWVQENAYNH